MDPTPEIPKAPLISGWDALPFAGLGAVWFWLLHWRPMLPDYIPSHWNAAGRIDGWMAKDHFFTFSATITLSIWGILFLASLVLRASPRPRHRLGVQALLPLRGTLPLGLAVMTGFCAPMTSILGTRAMGLGLGAVVLSLLLGLIPLARMARRVPPIPGATEAHYRLGGLLYWNRDDDRIWVEKRLGIGWTLNFAHAQSWLLLGVLLLPGLVLALVLLTH